MDPFKKGFTQSDLEIMKRLEKLREDRVPQEPIPSDADIRKRLANLRNEPEASYSKSNIPIIKHKSDQEQCDDLLNQYMDERKIEEKRNAVDLDIAKRLQNLKGVPAATLSTNVGVASEAIGGGVESKANAITRVIQEAMLAPSDDELSDTSEYENNTSDELSSSDEDDDDSI